MKGVLAELERYLEAKIRLGINVILQEKVQVWDEQGRNRPARWLLDLTVEAFGVKYICIHDKLLEPELG